MSKAIPQVHKYMSTSPITVESSTSIADAHKLMRDNHFRHLPVVDHNELVGVISDRDVHLVSSLRDTDVKTMTVSSIMGEKPYAVDAATPLDEVVASLAERKLGSAIVTQNHKVVGIFTAVDALTAFAELLHTRLAK